MLDGPCSWGKGGCSRLSGWALRHREQKGSCRPPPLLCCHPISLLLRFLCGTVNDFVAEVGKAYERAADSKQEADTMARKASGGDLGQSPLWLLGQQHNPPGVGTAVRPRAPGPALSSWACLLSHPKPSLPPSPVPVCDAERETGLAGSGAE